MFCKFPVFLTPFIYEKNSWLTSGIWSDGSWKEVWNGKKNLIQTFEVRDKIIFCIMSSFSNTDTAAWAHARYNSCPSKFPLSNINVQLPYMYTRVEGRTGIQHPLIHFSSGMGRSRQRQRYFRERKRSRFLWSWYRRGEVVYSGREGEELEVGRRRTEEKTVRLERGVGLFCI